MQPIKWCFCLFVVCVCVSVCEREIWGGGLLVLLFLLETSLETGKKCEIIKNKKQKLSQIELPVIKKKKKKIAVFENPTAE